MELLVILFFFGLSAGTIGKIKGASFLLWFVVGFCLPFFGTVAAVVARNERAAPLRGCPDCGNVVPIQDQVCNRCGADLYFPEHEPSPELLHRQGRLFEG